MINDDSKFRAALSQMLGHPEIQKLKAIPQHKGGTTYAHCVHVAEMSFRLAEKLRLRIDPEVLAMAAMLHDYYLYDTETMPYSDYRHSLVHPKLAAQNAGKIFKIAPRTMNAILSHMWPIPGAPIPRCREAWLICLADKICAYREMYGRKRP